MSGQLVKSSKRLWLGLTLLCLLVGAYMYSMRVGILYRTVDGYLLVLPVARLGLMVMIVGLMLGLTRTLSETAVDGFGAAFRSKAWSPDDRGPKVYKGILRYPLMLAALVAGYFMLRAKIPSVVSPLRRFGWASLAFNILWAALVLLVLVLFFLKLKKSRGELRLWRQESREAKAARKVAVAPVADAVPRPAPGVHKATPVVRRPVARTPIPAAGVPAAAPQAPQPSPKAQPSAPVPKQPEKEGIKPEAAGGEARPVVCRKCGASIKPGIKFCHKCGAELA